MSAADSAAVTFFQLFPVPGVFRTPLRKPTAKKTEKAKGSPGKQHTGNMNRAQRLTAEMFGFNDRRSIV